MDKAIGLNIRGIKCDTQDCDYRDDSVKVEDYHQWLNKPCPKCNSNLLTQADYDNVQLMINLASIMNGILPAPQEDEDLFKVNVKMDGTGKMDMKIDKE